MPRLELHDDAVSKELAAFTESVRLGLGVLRRVGEVTVGATPRSVSINCSRTTCSASSSNSALVSLSGTVRILGQ